MVTEINLEIYPRKVWIVDMRGVVDCKKLNFKTKRLDGTFKKADNWEFENVKSLVVEATRNGKFGTVIFILEETDIDSIVHESVHIADYVFESLGMEAQSYSGKNEQYAYLVEYVFSKINNIFSKNENRRLTNRK